jgi:hypothetical protein
MRTTKEQINDLVKFMGEEKAIEILGNEANKMTAEEEQRIRKENNRKRLNEIFQGAMGKLRAEAGL